MVLSTRRFLISQAVMIPLYGLLLSISIMIQDDEFVTYGKVAYQETFDWNKNVITAVETSFDHKCPPNYETLESVYLGLHTICRKENNLYDLDICKKNNGKTQFGTEFLTLKQFDNVTICY